MDLIRTSLFHRVVPPSRHVEGNCPALIMLHGRGADENDLLGLAEHLDERFMIISVRAPFRFEWGGGFTWYHVLEVGKPEPRMFKESFDKLEAFLSDVVGGYAINRDKVFLLGFSMGTMMAYSLLLTTPEAIAGVVAHSGYIPDESDLNFRWKNLKGKGVFIAHGTEDTVIPVGLCHRARQLFEPTDAEVTFREYPMGHQISQDSLTDFSSWLTDRLDENN